MTVRGTGGTFETFDKIAHQTNCADKYSSKPEGSQGHVGACLGVFTEAA